MGGQCCVLADSWTVRDYLINSINSESQNFRLFDKIKFKTKKSRTIKLNISNALTFCFLKYKTKSVLVILPINKNLGNYIFRYILRAFSCIFCLQTINLINWLMPLCTSISQAGNSSKKFILKTFVAWKPAIEKHWRKSHPIKFQRSTAGSNVPVYDEQPFEACV